VSDVRDLGCEKCGKIWAVECNGADPRVDCCSSDLYLKVYEKVVISGASLRAAFDAAKALVDSEKVDK
jgi:hypothetical protein